ncbi:uncharacterized protein LOC126778585 [Nymphalis io]|uniref:uncharacterized protein LOC126778585 n=1 Tax=Inachis io TaxID=171585 RepID=UPI00216781B4|nr:uncharacterized protein LOC126778585 [Nymphalis io]XP_050358218.1 uncharacterized protein LOC126778585 [Nymphalis io]
MKFNYSSAEYFAMVDFKYLISLCIAFYHTSGQFQEHIDLQKISEVMFRNEKFNVLKPTVHVIQDHFKEFIQKRNSVNFPTERVFLDKNGFRHFWEGMEFPRPKSLRKAIALNTDKEIIQLKHNNKQIPTATDTNKNDTNVKMKDKPKRKKKIEADILIPAKQTLRGKSTVVKTTFFCPFFGVITMSTNVDKHFDDSQTLQDIK